MGWLVGVVRPYKHREAKARLGALGFESLFPNIRIRIIRKGRAVWQNRYLYGRYFFVLFTSEWRYLFGIPEVSGILVTPPALCGTDPAPLLVPNRIIEEIRQFAGAVQTSGGVPLGSRVRFKGDGPFRGWVGKYESKGVLLMDMLGRKVRISIDPALLELA